MLTEQELESFSESEVSYSLVVQPNRMSYHVNKANYLNAHSSILTYFMTDCMIHMSLPDLPPQGLSPPTAEPSEAAKPFENVYILEALEEQSIPYEQLQVSQSGNESDGNLFINLDDFMDPSLMDFIQNVVPPKAIGQDHKPENQQVPTQAIEPNNQTLPKRSLLPLKRKITYFEERNRVSAFSTVNEDVNVVHPAALPSPKWRLVEVEYLMKVSVSPSVSSQKDSDWTKAQK